MASLTENNRVNLKGMKEICDYVGMSESTVLNWIRMCSFPAKKAGGIYVSTRKKIDKWFDEYPEMK